MKNLYAFLAFSYVSSSRTRDVLSFTTADSTCGCAIFILVDLCPIHHSKLYAKGATFICAFERSLAICIPHRPITFPLSYGTFFHFLPSDKRTACWSFPAAMLYTANPSIPHGSVDTSWTGAFPHKSG